MYLTSQAHAEKSQRWWHLSSIQLAGGIISLPVIAVGYQILPSIGFLNAILSILLGNLIIFFISYAMINMSSKGRLNAVENAEQYIGKTAGRVLAFFILVTMIGWAAWILATGTKLLQMHPLFSKFSIGSFIGLFASLILLVGIRGVKFLCTFIIIPLIIVFLLFFFNNYSNLATQDIQKSVFFNISGISLVLSSNVAAVIDYPTFFRHSKSKKESLIAIIIIFFVTSIVQCSGLFLFNVFSNEQNQIYFLFKNSYSSFVLIIFLILSMLSGVCWNIYTASVGWESLFPKLKDRTEYALIGLIATVFISYISIDAILIYITGIFDTVICGVGGVLILDYLLNKQKKNFKINNISWLLGSILGVLVYFKFFYISWDSVLISLLSSFVLASFIYFTYNNFFKKTKT